MFGKNDEAVGKLRNEIAVLRRELETLRADVGKIKDTLWPENPVRCNVGFIEALERSGMDLAALSIATRMSWRVLRQIAQGLSLPTDREEAAIKRALGNGLGIRREGRMRPSEINAILGREPTSDLEAAPERHEEDLEPQQESPTIQTFVSCCPNIIDKMRERGMTLEQLAAASGLGLPGLRAILLARYEPNEDEKRAICGALGLAVGWAFRHGSLDTLILDACMSKTEALPAESS